MRNHHAVLALVVVAAAGPALAGAHTWDVNELFSNADGTIQFIELREANGGTAETGVGGRSVTSTSSTFVIPSSVAAPTSFKHILLATAAFAALPGAPTPDHIIPENFFSLNADTITYVPYDSLSFTAGQLPTDGVMSFNDGNVVAANSPTNYAGQTGSVDASAGGAAPPAVPDGTAGTTPVRGQMLDTTGEMVSISWDTKSCADAMDHQIVYGQRSDLPGAPGGAFSMMGALCAMGATSPYVWDGMPAADDGSGLIWWLVIVNNGDEGSWGQDGSGAERIGPGQDGSSGECGVTTKDLSNICGH